MDIDTLLYLELTAVQENGKLQPSLRVSDPEIGVFVSLAEQGWLYDVPEIGTCQVEVLGGAFRYSEDGLLILEEVLYVIPTQQGDTEPCAWTALSGSPIEEVGIYYKIGGSGMVHDHFEIIDNAVGVRVFDERQGFWPLRESLVERAPRFACEDG
ncbi:unnamed protein product [Polarella glacialis]|uniref:Uncharacterized protein n=1 Tax=Polarella glacialis TaxID=89957 RepID=A0A813I5Q2_POLGL|nr:unnamed protein product [Polarella glacialis]